MAQSSTMELNPQLDLGQIRQEAQLRWLRALEICEILRNYRKVGIHQSHQTNLLRELRYFPKDGYNWKKKDGKTMKEAYKKLKVGGIDVLHCYYAHGEDDENFQRRSYRMLEEDLADIVLVHYREVKVYNDEKGPLVSSNTKVGNNQTSDVNHMNQLSDLSFMDNQGLKKYDSFNRWAINELGDLDDSQITLNFGIPWSTLESDSVIAESSVHFDKYLMGPSISDQLVSIIDFSPKWTYTEPWTRVHVKGKFLMNKHDAQKCSWSCMFGEIEVPADIMADGTLCCHAPTSHKPGRVPFYVTCSNRLACSEICEFEYKMNEVQKTGTYNFDLLSRFKKLLDLENDCHSSPDCSDSLERTHANCTVCSMTSEGDELLSLFKHGTDKYFSDITPEDPLEEELKQKLHVWLLHKFGKDPHVLDDEGQGVLHLAAALGYAWAIKPLIAAGVAINFRDLRGWTALHWAACFGRAVTVVYLIALDASTEALTDPTPEFPSGRTPEDLASQNGYEWLSKLPFGPVVLSEKSAVRKSCCKILFLFTVWCMFGKLSCVTVVGCQKNLLSEESAVISWAKRSLNVCGYILY